MLDGIFIKVPKWAGPFGVDFWAFILEGQIDTEEGDFALKIRFNKVNKIIVNLKNADGAYAMFWGLDNCEPDMHDGVTGQLVLLKKKGFNIKQMWENAENARSSQLEIGPSIGTSMIKAVCDCVLAAIGDAEA